jgi:hypothetical protein
MSLSQVTKTNQFIGRVLSNQDEPPRPNKKIKKGKHKPKVNYLPWKERSKQEEVVKSMTDEEALRNFMEDPGLTWLLKQCESYIMIFVLFSDRLPSTSKAKNHWMDDFEEAGSVSTWPGKESDDGLRAEHLCPDCESRIGMFCLYS